jgi:hypothetical protein
VLASAETVVSRPAGYGGFTTEGAYRISAGDPDYKEVLSGHPVGEPVTSVTSTVVGDSTLMFVQESPSQMRVHRVDMDAKELIRQIGDITNKGLAAWVKYMGGTPVP